MTVGNPRFKRRCYKETGWGLVRTKVTIRLFQNSAGTMVLSDGQTEIKIYLRMEN